MLLTHLLPERKVGNLLLMNTRGYGWRRTGLTLAAYTVLLLAVGSAVPASAQQIRVPFKVEAFGGVSYMWFNSKPLGYGSNSNLVGWNGTLSVPHIFRRLGFMADSSGHYGSGLREYNVLIGPQIRNHARGLTFTEHALYGRARDRIDVNGEALLGLSGLGRALAFGFSAQKDLNPRWSFRVVQLDYIRADTFGLAQNNVRASTGLVYHFGGK